MTFPNFPKRSSSDDDALDQALNAWVSGEQPDPANDLADDALDFHRWADEARRTDSAATGPATGTWNRVLRSTAQTTDRGGDMSSAVLSTEPQSAIVQEVRPWDRQQISRYLNNAAMLVIVFGVAFAGAFASMQVNQPGDSNGQLALLGQSDQSATCDVEPMTVDEVMEIVENPYKYATSEEYGMSGSSFTPWYEDIVEVAPMMPQQFDYRGSEPPTTTAFSQALQVLDHWYACMENGTVGQSLRFVDPFSIRSIVTEEFPFYRDEADVREFVAEWINSGPYPNQWVNEETGKMLYFNPNRIREEAGTQHMQIGLGFTQFIFVGSEVKDEDGNLLARHDSSMQVSEGEQQERWVQHVLVYSRYTDQWYVVAGSWPYEPQF